MLILLTKLLLAHLLGDFVFQPTTWVKSKQKKMYRSPFLYMHLGVHLLALLFLLQFDVAYWLGVVIIVATHFFIDLAKLAFQSKKTARSWFFIDQFLHIAVLFFVANLYVPNQLDLELIYAPEVLLFVVFLLFSTVVSSVVMQVIISKWKLENDDDMSLKNAGAYIGILERLFIFGFIILNYWAGIGFLLAAKSIFRFGDLTRAQDRKLTEYILMGTLLSFGMAILAGLGFNYFKTML